MNATDKIQRLKELKIAQLEIMHLLQTYKLESPLIKRAFRNLDTRLKRESFLLKKSLHSANSII